MHNKKQILSQTKSLKLETQSGEMARIESIMRVTLSADHRVVDGAAGARWLQAFKKAMESPYMLMI